MGRLVLDREWVSISSSVQIWSLVPANCLPVDSAVARNVCLVWRESHREALAPSGHAFRQLSVSRALQTG